MAADVRFNDTERDALQGLPLPVRWLYFEIRARMDYTTGLTGAKRGAGVSWRTFQEALFVEPGQGLDDTGTPHKSRVRRWAEWLVRAGLVVDRTTGKRLVFELPMATSDFSARKKPDTNPTQTRHTFPDTEHDTRHRRSGAVLAEKPDTQPDTNPTHHKPQKADTPPVSGVRLPVEPSSTHCHVGGKGETEEDASRPDVIPTERGRYAVTLRKLGVSVSSAHPTLLGWVEKDVPLTLLEECVGLARRYKPGNQAIAANYLDRIVQGQLSGGNNGMPEWARLPRDDAKLEGWARKHGYPMAPRGMASFAEYRAMLRTHIEKRLQEQDRQQG